MAGGLFILSASSSLEDWLTQAEGAVSRRAYVAGRFALELEGLPCGFLTSFEGGNITADIVREPMGPDLLQRKHLAGVRIEPITVECGLDLAKPWYDWIAATLNGQASRKNGAIVALDFNYKEIGRRTFVNAMISEVEFPTLDASSKEPGRLAVTLVPESLRFDPPSQKLSPPPAVKAPGQKQWLASNFRLNIQGLEPATAKVNKIETWTIKQKTMEQAVGQLREMQKQPAGLEYPNLIVTLPESQAGLLYGWHQDFVIKGNNGQDREKPGVLELLGPDPKIVLAALQFSNLGIFKLAPEPAQPGSDMVSRVKAEMYCEKITATFNI